MADEGAFVALVVEVLLLVEGLVEVIANLFREVAVQAHCIVAFQYQPRLDDRDAAEVQTVDIY